MKSDENGFTGLEAAIVLIAFIVVAAVFSYVVLGAGFFTVQTAQATVHTGVTQASSSIEADQNVIGVRWDATRDQLDYVNVSVALMAGGTPIDISQMVISYSDSNGGRVPHVMNETGGINDCGNILTTVNTGIGAPTKFCVSQKLNDLNPSSPNNLLEQNEVWILSIQTPVTAIVNTRISINLQPAVGAVLSMTRTLPGAFSTIQIIY